MATSPTQVTAPGALPAARRVLARLVAALSLVGLLGLDAMAQASPASSCDTESCVAADISTPAPATADSQAVLPDVPPCARPARLEIRPVALAAQRRAAGQAFRRIRGPPRA